MRILVVIESDHNAKSMIDHTIRWACRAGFDLRVFISPYQRKAYEDAFAEANYQWYLDLEKNQLISNKNDVHEYARQMGYTLLVVMPDDLFLWRKRTDMERQTMLFAEAMGKARIEFGSHPRMKVKHFANGVNMYRVK